MTTPMQDLLNTLEQAEEHTQDIPCFLCHDPSEKPLIIITEDPNEGAPADGCRAVIVGVCPICWDNEYHNLVTKAKTLMASSGLALPNQLFKTDVILQ